MGGCGLLGREVLVRSDACGLHLLPRVVTGPDERAAFDMLEAELHSDLIQLAELFRRDIAIEFDMAVGGAEVLAERENVDVDGAELQVLRGMRGIFAARLVYEIMIEMQNSDNEMLLLRQYMHDAGFNEAERWTERNGQPIPGIHYELWRRR